jgi:hypothetical protein
MKPQAILLSAAALLLVPMSNVHSQTGPRAFSFNAAEISGAGTAKAFLTGGGVFDVATGLVKGGGAFRCLADINQGPLAGCKAGEGIRWDAKQLLTSTGFKCTTNASEAGKTAFTDEQDVVILADFYRQGDGVNESFTARMIVSSKNLAPDLPGNSNVWLQGVGCADAIVNLR